MNTLQTKPRTLGAAGGGGDTFYGFNIFLQSINAFQIYIKVCVFLLYSTFFVVYYAFKHLYIDEFKVSSFCPRFLGASCACSDGLIYIQGYIYTMLNKVDPLYWEHGVLSIYILSSFKKYLT